ncbi:uncharacterized protein LOC113350768 [Papaver somniferum]|uniref:uncharacterized protein LOC113350768 n=1 Tax=Papaver somniferum TaxID=3469 RepID=UPI000E70039A|nr:uncharacterized protein LOC113350768 [Papaver somniferum]
MDSYPKSTLFEGFKSNMLGFNKNEKSQVIPSKELPDDLFEESLDPWRFSLIVRLNLQQTKFVDAAILLRRQWKLHGDCKLIPLGRGFFTIKLDNEVDRQYIKEGKWEVLNQILQVRKWISNFRPESQRTSKAIVWVRLPCLGLEFWSEKILFKICKEIGIPIKLDEATARCEVGYYANVLVEIDFAKTVPNKVWIGTKYGGFLQNISIPVFPKFCHTCKIVGHSIVECGIDTSKHQQASNMQNNMSPTPTNVQQQTPKVPHIPFDICDRSEVERSCSNTERRQSSSPDVNNMQILEEDIIISNIVTPVHTGGTSAPVNINSGRFHILNQEDNINVDEEIIADQENPKNSSSTEIPEVESIVKFVDVVSGKSSKNDNNNNRNNIEDIPKVLKITEENSL